ncbi:MAG TPA: hypothetical protein VMF32_12990 [Xanthobacteraceae bacterium]|nr:hypothetical protein [Xanthobacteraceae bacterium]
MGQTLDRGRDVFRMSWFFAAQSGEGAIGFRQQAVKREGGYRLPVTIIVQHLEK